MRVLVTTEAHFQQDSKGMVFSDTGGRGYSFWARYLDAFESVTVIARLSPKKGEVAVPVEGPGVCFVPLSGYTGPEQYLRNLWRLKRQVRLVCQDEVAVIARAPGAVATLVVNELHKKLRPYALEVVGDPYDAFSPGAVKHPLRPFFRWLFSRQLQRQCKRACAVAYVTEGALQRRYPPAPRILTTHYSSVELPDEAFVQVPRLTYQGANTFTIVTVGSLAHLYKAPDVLIDAVGVCIRDRLDLRLTLIGDGKYRPELEARASALGLGERVSFLGQLPAGKAVRAQLDQADLFALPSRQEGLSRATIEAMARALPCIGSRVGGTPELLAPEDMVPPGNVTALATRIREVLLDPARMARMSARNLEKAGEYRGDILRERRASFYQYVREQISKWMKAKGR